MPDPIQAVVALAVLLRGTVEAGLLGLNLRHAAAAGGTVPDALRGQVSPETGQRSLDYTRARGRLGLVHVAWSVALTLGLLFSGVLPGLDRAVAGAGLAGPARFVAFLMALSALTSVAGLPFHLYATFVLEARFGFNRTTWGTWLADQAKGLALSIAIGVPLLLGAWFFMEATGALWWLWLWAFLAGVQVLLLWLYPALIAPMFNRFSPLPDGDLRRRLEDLCRTTGFRIRGLFVMDASRRSAHSNAWFMGLVRPRIVLFDTLVSSMDADEAVAVLAHEIGHFRERHVLKRVAAGLLSSLAALWVLSRLVAWPPFFRAFGFAGPSWGAAVALLAVAGGAFTFFLAPLGAWWSRRHEYAADRYAVRHAGSAAALQRALVKLGGENLTNLHPHPWYTRWHATHPPLVERLAALDAPPW